MFGEVVTFAAFLLLYGIVILAHQAGASPTTAVSRGSVESLIPAGKDVENETFEDSQDDGLPAPTGAT